MAMGASRHHRCCWKRCGQPARARPVSEAIQIAVITALVNGAVTWGIINTKLAWLRRDVDKLDQRATACEAQHHHRRAHD